MNKQDRDLIEKGNEYAIYLHTNGELIYKPYFVYRNDSNYFDSPFVKNIWFVKPNEWNIQDYIGMLQLAKELGANKESIKKYLDTWAINEESFYGSDFKEQADINDLTNI